MRLSNNIKRVLSLCTALALIVCGVAVTPVSAGKAGGYVVDDKMLSTEELSQAEWKFDDTGVILKDGALVFDEFYDIENPVLSRTAAHSSPEEKLALEVRYIFNVDEIKGDKQFGLGFGIRRLDRDIDEEGATFLYVQATEKGMGFGLSTVKDGETVQLKELTHYGAKIKDANVTVRVTNEGALTVVIGSSIFYAGPAGEVTPDGYLGFSSAGGWTSDDCYVKANVANFVAYNEYYANPETPLMVVADFSGDEFNTNEWAIYSNAIGSGSGIIVEDGRLRFKGAGSGSGIAPQFAYSNFELRYDFFEMKNTPSYHNDVPVTPSWWCMIGWGNVAGDGYSAASLFSGYRLIFETSLDGNPESPTYMQRAPGGRMSVHFYDPAGWKSATPIPEKYDISQPTCDPEKRVQVRLLSVDGSATLYMKLQEETEWTEIWTYSYANGIMPTGFINIRTEGNQFAANRTQFYRGGWFSLDNIMIKNYDKNPSLTTVTFESNRLPIVPDYNYKDPYVDTYLIDYTGAKP